MSPIFLGILLLQGADRSLVAKNVRDTRDTTACELVVFRAPMID